MKIILAMTVILFGIFISPASAAAPQHCQKKVEELQKLNAQLSAKCEELYVEAQNAKDAQAQADNLNRMAQSQLKEKKVLLEKIKELQAAIDANNKEKAKIYESSGDAFLEEGVFSKASSAFAKVLELDKTNTQAWYKLGLSNMRQGYHNKEAIRCFTRYLTLAPDATNRKEVDYLITMLSKEELK